MPATPTETIIQEPTCSAEPCYRDEDMDATGYPNGKIIYWVDMENVHSWTAHTGPVLALAFNNRNDKLASAGADGFIVVWDICAAERPVEQPLWGHTKPVRALQWSAVWSDRLASGADDGTVRIWDVDTGGDPLCEEVPYICCERSVLPGRRRQERPRRRRG